MRVRRGLLGLGHGGDVADGSLLDRGISPLPQGRMCVVLGLNPDRRDGHHKTPFWPSAVVDPPPSLAVRWDLRQPGGNT
jgi:hypothetical protein